jgi:hypothetical protein
MTILAIILVTGVGALIVGFGVASAMGPTRARRYHVTSVGVLALFVLFALGLAFASSDSSSCHDCQSFFGRRVDPINFVALALNAIGWAVGTVTATSARVAGSRRVHG